MKGTQEVIGPTSKGSLKEAPRGMQEKIALHPRRAPGLVYWRVNVTAYSPEQGLIPVRTSATEASPVAPSAS